MQTATTQESKMSDAGKLNGIVKILVTSEINNTPDVKTAVKAEKSAAANAESWHGIDIVKFNLSFTELSVPAAPAHKITVNLTAPRYVRAMIGADRHEKFVRRDDISLIPAHEPSHWRHMTEAKSRLLQLYVEPAVLCEAARGVGVDPDKIRLVGRLGVPDLQIKHVAFALMSELEAGCPSGRLYGEAAATMLAAHLLKHYSTSHPVAGGCQGGIPQQKLRLILDHLNDRISESISLDELAAIAGWSRYHFIRQFKHSTGLAPHQFLLNLRVERAGNLLRNCAIPVADVALRTGFSDQSHLTRIFKKHFGLTPCEFRRSS